MVGWALRQSSTVVQHLNAIDIITILPSPSPPPSNPQPNQPKPALLAYSNYQKLHRSGVVVGGEIFHISHRFHQREESFQKRRSSTLYVRTCQSVRKEGRKKAERGETHPHFLVWKYSQSHKKKMQKKKYLLSHFTTTQPTTHSQ